MKNMGKDRLFFWIIITASFLFTLYRNTAWVNSLVLWSDCLSKSPAKIRTHHLMGIAFMEKGMIDEAEAEFMTAISKINEQEMPYRKADFLYFRIGQIYIRRGLYEKAEAAFKTALTYNSMNPVVRNHLGMLYLQKELPDKAENELRIALIQEPGYAYTHNNFAIIDMGKGLFDV